MAKNQNKVMAAWRFNPRLLKRLRSYAKRKRKTQTDLLEGWIDKFCITKKEED